MYLYRIVFPMFDILRIRDAPRVRSMPFILASRAEGGILRSRLALSIHPSTSRTLLHVGFGLGHVLSTLSHTDFGNLVDHLQGFSALSRGLSGWIDSWLVE